MKLLRQLLKPVALIILLGSLLTLVLTLITGSTNRSIMGRFYWLETDCSQYPGAPISGRCRWTSYNLCGVSGGKNSGCTSSSAGYAFSPKDNFSNTQNVPRAFITGRNRFFYMSRIGWAFEVIALFFLLCATLVFFVYALGFLKWLFWPFYVLALLFMAVSAAILTAAYVLGKNDFSNAGNRTTLGSRAISTLWITVGALIFNLFLLTFLAVTGHPKSNRTSKYGRSGRALGAEKANSYSSPEDRPVDSTSYTDVDSSDRQGAPAGRSRAFKFNFFRRTRPQYKPDQSITENDDTLINDSTPAHNAYV